MFAETERILIRDFTSDDIPALSRILRDPLVMEFSCNGTLTTDDTRRFIEWCISSYHRHGYGPSALIEKKTGCLVGYCGLSHTNMDGVDTVQIGYRLTPDQWGNGFASESASRVLDQGFELCNVGSVIGIVSTLHEASIHVLQKIGFRSFTETCYRGWKVRVYRLSMGDWKSRNT